MQRRTFLSLAGSLWSAARLRATDRELAFDVGVIGGGTGGVAAALAACRRGMRVALTEETDWLGGQVTAQAVPPDEHPWIEEFGCTRSYRGYRTAVRDYYRLFYPLTDAARARLDLNPGNGGVSRLTHEPRVSVAVLEAMLAPYVSSGQLTIFPRHVAQAAGTRGDRITDVTMLDLESGTRRSIIANYFLDATELGDLLPLSNTEFVTGAEAQTKTGEMHAAAEAQPENSQSYTFCFAIDHLDGEDHRIDRPAEYDFWRDYVPKLTPPWTGRLLNWSACEPKTLQPRNMYFEPDPKPGRSEAGLNLWVYRRITDRDNFLHGAFRSDITLVNWPQNDCWLGDLVTASAAEKQKLLARAKQLSLSLLYWMQTEAPRPDGGQGWKGLRLRRDITGTDDGLAKSVYVRESRRIRAVFTILEEHVGTEMRAQRNGKTSSEVSAEVFPDTIGIGCYRIDLHPSAGGTNYIDVSSLPFQIPLGALIPERMENLLPACKNIGTTHITNGCYRLHPVEWNIGEAAGSLAAFAFQKKTAPRAVHSSQPLLRDFQKSLIDQGVELSWPKVHAV